ncbi:MAG: PTS sugar transporter subunit IIA [Spirochaetes bacterium]|nr:MAG: PTS sugar transporter subunit IIA [Spirochaetota bacterium]RKX86695.1 MAG: PTS sugar transporter subunit IIA [Spirochaetota bacterium]RKX97822.1 MAG: PTS sugar transporter subunit IIA [Spirochaetota bacterium]
MYIIDYLKPEGIQIKAEGKNKKIIISSLLKQASENNIIPADKVEAIYSAVMDREQQSTTGIGNGISIPHCKTDLVPHGIILAATMPSGIKYNSIDNKPVNILLLFIFPGNENKEYLQVLAKTARLFSDEHIRNKLILSESSEEFRAEIAKNDVIPIQKGNNGEYLFILALSDQKKMQTVISSLVEIGAQTSLILDSETLEKKMAYDIPMFAGLSHFKGKSPYSKTFIGIMDNSNQIDYLNKLLIKEGIDLNTPGAGFLLTIKVEKIIGGIPEEIDV